MQIKCSGVLTSRKEEGSVIRSIGAESDLVVDVVVATVSAPESGAHIIVGVSVGSGAAFLEPFESGFNSVDPVVVLVHAGFSQGSAGDWEAFLIPVGAPTAVGRGTVLVATTNASAGVEVGHQVATSNSIVAVEGSTVVALNSTDLISSPITNKVSAGFLEEVRVAGVEADSASSAAAVI